MVGGHEESRWNAELVEDIERQGIVEVTVVERDREVAPARRESGVDLRRGHNGVMALQHFLDECAKVSHRHILVGGQRTIAKLGLVFVQRVKQDVDQRIAGFGTPVSGNGTVVEGVQSLPDQLLEHVYLLVFRK